MKIGITGLQRSGKTTVFNALTLSQADTDAYASSTTQPNIATVEVNDPRVDSLDEMYSPKKTTRATIECVDFTSMQRDKNENEIFSPTQLGLIKTMDALALVVRNFSDDVISEIHGGCDPAKDMQVLFSELIFSDMVIAENRLERIEHSIRRGVKGPEQDLEKATLEAILECLNASRPIRSMDLGASQVKSVRGFQFLTLKPVMLILNSDDQCFGKNPSLMSELSVFAPAIEFAGKFEMELGMLDEDEARMFMEDMHIEASARDRLTMLAYEVLGYITFFTVGPDEVRAWTIREMDTAMEAAGTIHSDLARGFIRAECFSFKDLMKHNTEKTLRDQGLVRLEGKTYTVKDGDILNIRFSV
jgi:GTP-binding protein YchF